MKCSKCDFENTQTSRFCSNCGTQLIPVSSVQDTPTRTLHTPMKRLKRGRVFGDRYEVIEELGEGGMGIVYKVFDRKIEDKVALKVLAPEIAGDEKTIERFRNELKLARKVSHRNVCRMYDLSEEEKTPFITMEFVPGENLKSLIKRVGQLSKTKTLSIAKQVCEGLTEAHRLGVVHRDLKPQNVMVDSEGNARIMDFGIARSIRTKSITETGMIIGTPEYMSPEQVEGVGVDHQSDIYSLGVILFEMLTGKVPFQGETPLSVILKHKTEQPPDPRKFDDQIPVEISQMILKCLEKDKNERYPTADVLLADLVEIEKNLTTIKTVGIGRKKEKAGKIKDRKIVLMAVLAFLMVAMVITALFFYPGVFKGGQKSLNSIAVLPLKNLSRISTQEYLSDGMTQALISNLAQMEALERVISSTSVMQYKDTTKPLPEIARELGVDAVVEGSVMVSQQRVLVSVQLIEARTDRNIWSNSYERDLRDILALQSELARAIAREIKIVVTPAEQARLALARPVNPEAYQLVLRARSLWNKRTQDDLLRAKELFEQAIELDPTFALAHAGLADAYSMLASYYYIPPSEAYPMAREAAQTALELDENLAEAYTSLAWVKYRYEGDWFGAETDYNWAIGLNPSYAIAHHWYGSLLRDMGRFDEALIEMEKARELNPFSLSVNTSIGYLFYFGRQYEQAITQVQKALQMDPDFHWAHDAIGLAHLQKGEFEEAIAAFQKAVSLSESSVDYLCHLAQAHALAGKTEEAQNVLEELLLKEETNHVPLHEIALLYKALNQGDQALAFLVRASDEQAFIVNASKMDPRWDSFREDPIYAEILEDIGVED
ncbi:MAG: protein kinase [Candidatus Aminicenantes bacterium]|nr:MAG: protein kinase [Candidatus Aminicenantes bacterium]